MADAATFAFSNPVDLADKIYRAITLDWARNLKQQFKCNKVHFRDLKSTSENLLIFFKYIFLQYLPTANM